MASVKRNKTTVRLVAVAGSLVIGLALWTVITGSSSDSPQVSDDTPVVSTLPSDSASFGNNDTFLTQPSQPNSSISGSYTVPSQPRLRTRAS